MNGVNLDNFQFEYDLTWMSFFQDHSGKTYARYGGRDDSGSESHLNQPSLVHTMRSVLKLHKQNATQKTSRYEPLVKTTTLPSDLPQMNEMIGRRKESCIHCHDVKVAKLRHLHDAGKLKKDMVFTYPSPSRLGIMLNNTQQSIVDTVAEESPAANAGLKAGDKLLSTDDFRILTYADLTRALELSPPVGKLPLKIERDGVVEDLMVSLPTGWRRSDDPSWRASLHTVGPGAGFWGRPANLDERQQLGLTSTDLALKVTFIWAPHAKAAKVRIGDVVIDLDGNRKNMNMRQCHGFLNMNRDWGDEITLTVMRRGKPVELQMTLPAQPPRD